MGAIAEASNGDMTPIGCAGASRRRARHRTHPICPIAGKGNAFPKRSTRSATAPNGSSTRSSLAAVSPRGSKSAPPKTVSP